MTKYIFTTGGNLSSLGKGIASATIGRLLKSRGLKVTVLKMDPYLNVDAGTMNPFQHGEVFVTDDGAETDLDLGHYERFIDINLSEVNNVTTGSVYDRVLRNEREGKYLGACVQVIPHLTDELKNSIRRAAKATKAEVCLVEIGGTVGDIEGGPFYEAIRQFRNDVGRDNALFVHLTLVPTLTTAGEVKTKLTQHTVKELRGIGIQPDIIICRSRAHLSDSIKAKISLFCDVPRECVISAPDVSDIYQIPINFEKEGITDMICNKLGIVTDEKDLSEWETMLEKQNNIRGKVTIGICGKYFFKDAYMSIMESLKHGGIGHSLEVDIKLLDSEKKAISQLRRLDGILVPGGFGYRGIEGKINAIKYARENNVPFLGICLGLQSAVIEFARNVCGLSGANSTEFDENTPHPVIDLMLKQRDITDKGGTMRLGLYPANLQKGSLAAKLYNANKIQERHRHRYEVNIKYHKALESNGLVLSGMSPDGKLAEMIELPTHPYFIGSQFHPEFKSRPTRPHPLFAGLVAAAWEYAKKNPKESRG
jgi:CTP synthase